MDDRTDERHHVYECPEAKDRTVEHRSGQSVVLHDAEESVDSNCADEYATCEIASRDKPPLHETCRCFYFNRIVLQSNDVEQESESLLDVCKWYLEGGFILTRKFLPARKRL
jgi:hypothetical protein